MRIKKNNSIETLSSEHFTRISNGQKDRAQKNGTWPGSSLPPVIPIFRAREFMVKDFHRQCST